MEKSNQENVIIIENISQQFFLSYVNEIIQEFPGKNFLTILYDFINYNNTMQTLIVNEITDSTSKKIYRTVRQTVKRKLELIILTCMYLFLQYKWNDKWNRRILLNRNDNWLNNIKILYEEKVKVLLTENDYLFMEKIVNFYMIENTEREFFNRKKSYQVFVHHTDLSKVDNLINEVRAEKLKLIKSTKKVDEIDVQSDINNSNPTNLEKSTSSIEVVHRKKKFVVKDPMDLSFSRSNKEVSSNIYI